MQKSQQWSFEHLQKQIDELPSHLADAGVTNATTKEKGGLAQVKELQALSIKSNATLAHLNCTNLVTCENGENCAEVTMCRLNSTCSLVQKCHSGVCEEKNMCAASQGNTTAEKT